jgi:hypothetical protein
LAGTEKDRPGFERKRRWTDPDSGGDREGSGRLGQNRERVGGCTGGVRARESERGKAEEA